MGEGEEGNFTVSPNFKLKIFRGKIPFTQSPTNQVNWRELFPVSRVGICQLSVLKGKHPPAPVFF